MIARSVDAWGRTIFGADSAFELLYAGLTPDEILVEPSEAMAMHDEWMEHFDLDAWRSQPIVEPQDSPETVHKARQQDWNIPPWATTCDMREVLHGFCTSPEEHTRVDHEMDLFEQRGMVGLLRALMVLVITWRQCGIVWGVGRGSSVASYCLYLLGVHRINPLKYGLDVAEFLR